MSRRLRHLAATLLVVIACSAIAPGVAAAQNSPFQGLPPATPAQQPTTTTAQTSSTQNSSLDTWQALMIAFGGVALLAAIGLVIVRDARSHTPAIDAGDAQTSRADAHQHSKRAKERARRQKRAARAARRKNR